MSGQFSNQQYKAMSSNQSKNNMCEEPTLPVLTVKRSTSTEAKIEPETVRQEECKKETTILGNIGNLMGPPTNYKRPVQTHPPVQYASIPKELYMLLYQNIRKKVIQDLYMQFAVQQANNTNNSYLAKRKFSNENEEYEVLAKKVQLTPEQGVYSKVSNIVVQPVKTPTPTPTTTITTPTTPETQPNTPPKKTRKRISMSQNYKGVLTRGFARTIVQSKEHPNSDMYKKFQTVLAIHQKLSAESLKEKTLRELESMVFRYIKENIQGKISYQTKNNKEAESSKINSTTQIKKVFFCEGDEDVETAFSKRVAYDMMIYFLSSSHFDQWVKSDCQSTEENKDFLLLNKDEFRKVFESPISYKPKFKSSPSHSDK